MSDLHVIIGASGSIGNAIIRALAQEGKQVRGVNRSGKALVPSGVEMLALDATRLDDMRHAIADASTVYNATFPAMQDALLEAASEQNVKYVLVNNLYMYDPEAGPMSETSPIEYADREGGKFYDDLAKEVIAAHQAGKVRGVVGRASDIFGRHVNHGYNKELVFGPASEGKAANILGAADVPHSFTYADDAGKAYATLGFSDSADGEIWHLPSMEPVTQENLLRMIYTEYGNDLKFRAANGLVITLLALFNAEMKKIKREKLYQFTTPWTVDSSKYEKVFGRVVTPVPQAVKETVAWFREHQH